MNSKEITQILAKYNDIIENYESSVSKKEGYSFNTFNISTYGTQLENFHSDIISELLNPNGNHNEKTVPVYEFLQFLNQFYDVGIDIKDFQNIKAFRELGRIDIALFDDESKKAIIIENKINNAPDMDDQLTRYYDWCINKGYEVKCVAYLTLAGEKNAPQIATNKNIKPINISAFSNTESDVVNGWITPLIKKCSFDTQSFLNQYKRLLIFLAYDKMENDYYKDFYDLADDMSALKKIETLKKLSDDIPVFRMDKFVKELTDFSPFSKSYRWKPWHMLYERFQESDNSFKIDVWFDSNGDSWVHFWNPNKEEDDAFESCQEKIREIGFENRMTECRDDWVGYSKGFLFSDFSSLKKIDEEVLGFTKELMTALRKK